VLRIAFLVAKPVIESLAGLVMLGLLPSVIALNLFIYLMLTWASLQLGTINVDPFARFRIPFVVVAVGVLVLAIALVIAVAASDATDAATVRQDVVSSGSYVLAALYAAVCVLVILAGFGLRKSWLNYPLTLLAVPPPPQVPPIIGERCFAGGCWWPPWG